jgi:transcriptional regulator with XRE-family HTH domain
MVVNTAEDPRPRLARRLRRLRTEAQITQAELAEALGASAPLISSWESRTAPALPPPERLEAYARFFATESSVQRRPFRLISETQLTKDELQARDALYGDLLTLRNAAVGDRPAQSAATTDPYAGSHWRFPPDEDVVIVGSALPEHLLEQMPFTDRRDPDFVNLFRFADPDALIELFGFIRAANPTNRVRFRTPADVFTEDYTSHLVLLGGVDWNAVTAELLEYGLDLPVRQLRRKSEADLSGFVVTKDGEEREFSPVLRTFDGREVLVEDVAHFYRAPNPLNEQRTITICNGAHQRGTVGAVRALTDSKFRDGNEEYLRTRFGHESAFSIVTRVLMVRHAVVTPNWTGDAVLHEWPV